MAQGLLKRPDDRFANIVNGAVTESAAVTFTTGPAMDFGIGLGTGMGLLIDSISYYVDPGVLMNLGGEAMRFGIAVRDDLTTMADALAQQAIIHAATLGVIYEKTSGGTAFPFPLEYKFTPPLITVGNRGRLFPIIHSSGLTTAVTMQCRIYFRYIPLKGEDYLELAESFNLVG